MPRKNFIIVGLIIINALSPINISLGATATSTFQITSTAASSCTVSANTLPFPNYTLVQLGNSTILTVTCTNGTTYSIGLSAGTGSGATVTTRKMTMTGSQPNTINYSLYTDSARTTVWGDTAGNGLVTGLTGTGTAQTYTVYGRVFKQQASPIGSYADTITITINF